MVYVTRGLLDALLDLSRDAEPEALTVDLAVTRAGEFDATLPMDPDQSVFTHFYLPDAGRSVTAVFGVNLSTPPGQSQGRFVTHPQGTLEVTREDDLHGVIIVAVPPWDDDSVAAFGRSGRPRELTVVEAAPPEEELA